MGMPALPEVSICVAIDGDRRQSPEHVKALGQPMTPELTFHLLSRGLLILLEPVSL